MINYLLQCKNIDRMSMMFKNRSYNLMEHQWMVGMLFQHFASLEDVSYDINVWDIVLKHDLVETVTTDLPYPIKNFSTRTKELWDSMEEELVKKHFKLEKYTDSGIKNSLTERQFNLFKICDTLDLLIFTIDEIHLGNQSKQMLAVKFNCYDILDRYGVREDFPKIFKYIQTL